MPWQQCFLNRHILHGERSALLKSARQIDPHPGKLHPTVPGRFVGVPKDSRDRTGTPPPETVPIQRIEYSTSFTPIDALASGSLIQYPKCLISSPFSPISVIARIPISRCMSTNLAFTLRSIFWVLIPSGINGMSETRSSAPREILFA